MEKDRSINDPNSVEYWIAQSFIICRGEDGVILRSPIQAEQTEEEVSLVFPDTATTVNLDTPSGQVPKQITVQGEGVRTIKIIERYPANRARSRQLLPVVYKGVSSIRYVVERQAQLGILGSEDSVSIDKMNLLADQPDVRIESTGKAVFIQTPSSVHIDRVPEHTNRIDIYKPVSQDDKPGDYTLSIGEVHGDPDQHFPAIFDYTQPGATVTIATAHLSGKGIDAYLEASRLLHHTHTMNIRTLKLLDVQDTEEILGFLWYREEKYGPLGRNIYLKSNHELFVQQCHDANGNSLVREAHVKQWTEYDSDHKEIFFALMRWTDDEGKAYTRQASFSFDTKKAKYKNEEISSEKQNELDSILAQWEDDRRI